MIELSPIEIELLEEFREELGPRVISDVGFAAELPAALVQALYKLVCEKVAENELPYKVLKSLREVS
ncbi:hypothetical protein [Acinetobacter tianfuensis]|uniref:Uncharacterized protein n=1 Tax=Acinetobacter tianfuensis TaxID=2419603 RepID=A0A3A8EB95_9GAMM|nr:hypothetical protein [Acinetobacter tianfuensis]RKG31459.1 hypothetical protein D7V32_08320 [Acinetobacter tianfuensis]